MLPVGYIYSHLCTCALFPYLANHWMYHVEMICVIRPFPMRFTQFMGRAYLQVPACDASFLSIFIRFRWLIAQKVSYLWHLFGGTIGRGNRACAFCWPGLGRWYVLWWNGALPVCFLRGLGKYAMCFCWATRGAVFVASGDSGRYRYMCFGYLLSRGTGEWGIICVTAKGEDFVPICFPE